MSADASLSDSNTLGVVSFACDVRYHFELQLPRGRGASHFFPILVLLFSYSAYKWGTDDFCRVLGHPLRLFAPEPNASLFVLQDNCAQLSSLGTHFYA